MNGLPHELGDCGALLVLPCDLAPATSRIPATSGILGYGGILGSGFVGRARPTKPQPSGRPAPHGAPARTLVRNSVLPNKEPQP
ncbi:hypothetical protein ABZZ47_33150 [Streptomyces sp. NPDC006465]|uniref:hypothetical protein n=1 Tax=Streptomyces sp. NPDC006465 TaxID=3157174 RepID=UPI0033B0EB42